MNERRQKTNPPKYSNLFYQLRLQSNQSTHQPCPSNKHFTSHSSQISLIFPPAKKPTYRCTNDILQTTLKKRGKEVNCNPPHTRAWALWAACIIESHIRLALRSSTRLRYVPRPTTLLLLLQLLLCGGSDARWIIKSFPRCSICTGCLLLLLCLLETERGWIFP